MNPHKWAVVERRAVGVDHRFRTVYADRVLSRHKSELAAKTAAGTRMGVRVRRLRNGE